MYSIDRQGKLVAIDNKKSSAVAEPFDTSHLLAFPVNEDFSLVLDTIHDALDVVPKDTATALFENQGSLPHTSLAYFRGRFCKDGWQEEAKQTYDDAVAHHLKTDARMYSICLTYSCNMSCTYCYQQHDEKLDKSVISEENFQKLLAYIEEKSTKERAEHPERPIVIQLFGGEPFQKRLHALNERLFAFAERMGFTIVVTTNGLEIDSHMDIIKRYLMTLNNVAITLDGLKELHEKRRIHLSKLGNFDRIVKNMNDLLEIGIAVMVSINIDRENVGQLPALLDFARKQGWADNPYVLFKLGRVDDRKYEIPFARDNVVLTEAELLQHLGELNAKTPFPSNFQAGFAHTLVPLSRRFGFDFGQDETARLPFTYCWATSPAFLCEYIDAKLQTYRCTYTVGDTSWACGSVDGGGDTEKDLESTWYAHNALKLPDCQTCPLAGYCSGGCRLSAKHNPRLRCEEEFGNINMFVSEIVVPRIREQLEAQLRQVS